MSLTIPVPVLATASHPVLTAERERSASWSRHVTTLDHDQLTPEILDDLATAAAAADNKPFGRIIASIQAARTGDFSKSIPRFEAAPEMLRAFLRHNLIDGWVYRKEGDGHLHAYLVTRIDVASPRDPNDPPELRFKLLTNNDRSSLGSADTYVSLKPEHVTRKKVGDVLASQGLFKETPELKKAYEAQLEDYRIKLTGGFAQQYRFTGLAFEDRSWGRATPRENRKVVHDISPKEIPTFSEWAPSELHIRPSGTDAADANDVPGSTDGNGSGPVPIRPMLRVFDLGTHDTLWVNATDMASYEYDHSLAEKLILPPDQRELLDILTTDISTFASDIIEGKSAGNVILCKGIPGVGKTLSAEIYAELIERPLYAIHSGSLGTDASSIRKNLERIFGQAKRWDAVLLLDEADVFVIERGTNIEQNAIVAEFLRTLEYFDGLLFLTTNRANEIDEAIISRCAAIIDYRVPGRADAARIWQVMATNYGTTLDESLLEALLDGFPKIAPRDIKMLLRLALRVSAHRKEELSLDVFRRCAMFRGLHLSAFPAVPAAP